MPDPTPITPPAAPVVTPPPVDPPVETPPIETPVNAIDDPMLGALADDFRQLVTPVEPPEEPVITKVDESALTPKPGETPVPPATPPPVKKKKLEIVEPTPAPAAAPAPASVPVAVAPVAPTPEPPDPDADYIKGLTDEQREELAEAEFAEKNLGNKYAGQRKKLIESFKAVDKFAAENPDAEPDSEEFQKILRAKPTLSGVDARKVVRGMAVEEFRKSTASDTSTADRLRQVETTAKIAAAAPEIANVLSKVVDGITEIATKDPELKAVMEIVTAKGYDEAAKEYPLEVQAFSTRVDHARAISNDYVLFAKDLATFDPKNQNHAWLADFVAKQGEHFKKNGGERLTDKQGRTFLTRAEYNAAAAKDPDFEKKHFTFTHRNVLEMIAANAVLAAKADIAAEDARVRGLGYERRKAGQPAPSAKPTTEPTPVETPGTRGRPSPGPAAPTAKPAPEGDSPFNAATML